MFKYLSIFKRKKKRNTSLFQKHGKTQATYKKRKDFSLKINHDFLQNMRFFYMFLGALVFSSLIYLFVFSEYFLIQKIKIERQDNNSNIEIAYNILGDYVGTNIFLFDIPEAKKKLIDSQENLGRVTILKQFPKTLKLDITSYPSLYNTTIEESEYLVLLNGSITPGKRNGLLTLDMKFSEFPRFYEYKKILKAEELKSIFELEKLMKSNFLTIQSEKINYYIDEKEAHFILKSGLTLIFDLLGNPKEQIEKLSVYHNEQRKIDTVGLIYIDLRVSDKIYTCDSKQEYNCYNNLKYLYGEER